MTYHQLGRVAEEREDFVAAETWYRKALDIQGKLGNQQGAALTYGQLGTLAVSRGDFAAADHWYRMSLAIYERIGDEHGAAMTQGGLGVLAANQHRFVEAGRWYVKALKILRINDPHGFRRNSRNFAIAGDLARQALLVLSEDPGTRQAIEAMAEHSPEHLDKFFTGTEIPLATSALIALSTQVEISYDKGLKFKLKTKPLSDSALKSLVEKLISYLP